MFGSGSSLSGFEKGLYYLERILDMIIRLFNSIGGNKNTTAPETTQPEVED